VAPEPVWTGAENLAPNGILSPDLSVHSDVSFVLYLHLNKPTEMSVCDTDCRTSSVLASGLLLALGVSQQLQWPAVQEEPSALTDSALVTVTQHNLGNSLASN